MEIKKNPKYKLENYSSFFFELGLVLALFITYLTINIKSFDKTTSILSESSFKQSEVVEEIPITKQVEDVKPPPPPPPAPEVLDVVQNNAQVDEVILASTEADENTAVKPVNIKDIKVVKEDEEVVPDIPFAIIENPPVFPGCKGSKAAKKKCFENKIDFIVKKNFNSGIAQELGLTPGIKKIFVEFVIDKTGKVANIKIRAPQKSLKEEALRVIKLLPKMKPGMQRNRPVGVRYDLPIVFKVL